MKSASLLFIHCFCHKTFAYHFEETNEDDWITRYFFTGGTMPFANPLLYFQDYVSILNHWQMNGKHYAYTSPFDPVDGVVAEDRIASIDPKAKVHHVLGGSYWKVWVDRVFAEKVDLI